MAGYSKKTLIQKLGIKNEVIVIGLRVAEYYKILDISPKELRVTASLKKDSKFIHAFLPSVKELHNKIGKIKKTLAKDGALWLSWPKKSSAVSSDLSENIIRDIVLKEGLVDVKVAAINDIWSGLKFVYRLKDR